MALLPCLVEVLKRERVPYLTLRHPAAFTAPELSAVAHIPGRRSAKVVICIADNQPVQAVVPAHYTIDFDALRKLVGSESLRLAQEHEVAALYPEFEVGAMPPFGMRSSSTPNRPTLMPSWAPPVCASSIGRRLPGHCARRSR